jgi:2-polyprenyl-3-methyl-5-hydroxy-6-metoxy-1,4-benzoquinol methylase
MNLDKSYIDWKDWNEESFGYSSKLEEVYFDNIFKILKLRKSSLILEIGFGNGSFLGYALQKNMHYEGVEQNELLLDWAHKRNITTYTSINKIEKNRQYDLIILFDVIEHIKENDVQDFLREMYLHLNSNGSIFLRFPNGASPLALGNQYGDVTHCNVVTMPKLSYWCYNSDLKVIFYRGDIRPFIYKHNFIKMPSKLLKRFFYVLTEKFIRFISNQSKGILASNLEVILKKTHEN